jgi:hypothetical protein
LGAPRCGMDESGAGASVKGAAGSRKKSWCIVLSGGASRPPYPKLGDASAATLFPWRLKAVSLSVLSERKLTHLSGLADQDVDSQPGVS